MHINFEDKRGLMGFQLLPVEPGDEDIYEVFTITSPLKWTPHKFLLNKEDKSYYDPTDSMVNITDYPAVLNHTSIKLDSLGENDHLDD